MSRHYHHDTQKAYDMDVARHLSYESFGREKVSEAEITPEARPSAPHQLTPVGATVQPHQLTEAGEESPVDNNTVAQ
jgi:hypothetical protein